MRALEPIFAALFALAQSANSGDTPFGIQSRRWISWEQMTPDQSPALFQLQVPMAVSGGARPLPKFELQAEWYLYLATNPNDFETATSTPLNNYITALINAITPKVQGQKQTLGGLVENAYIDGKIVIDEGIITSPAIAVIPITILTGY